MGAREGGALGVDQAAVGPRPVDRVLDLVDADEDDREPDDEDADLRPAPADGEQRPRRSPPSGRTTAAEPSAVTPLATSTSQPVCRLSATSIAVRSPGVGPGSPPTITV